MHLQALAQGDAQAVKAHGDNFEREIRTFTQQYGGVTFRCVEKLL
jgi:uncharacterized Rossmann fold enzyme